MRSTLLQIVALPFVQHFFASTATRAVSPACEKTSRKCSRVTTISCSYASKVKRRPLTMPVEDRDRELIAWWQERMSMCQKPTTRELIKRLDGTNLLGLDPSLRFGSLRDGTLNAELLEYKRKFPREVLLYRVGEFYEACGFDACLLVEFAGLNPMGGSRSDCSPRAGCPVANLRQALDAITRVGLSVCVVEEVQGPAQFKHRKDRFIAGHAHPGSPYIYGLAEADTDIDFPEPCPVVGVSHSVRGYCLVSVLEVMRTYTIEDGLTEEALVTKLRSLQCQQLFLHRSIRDNSSERMTWKEGGLLWGECKGKYVEWFDQDPVLHLIAKVREMYDIDDKDEFREIVKPSVNRPRPIYMGTASQVGILPIPGIPSLLKALVSPDCPSLSVRFLRDLLLNPPPYTVASTIQAAVKLMSNLRCSVPEFVCVPAAKLCKLIGAREVNNLEFSRIKNMAEDVLYMYQNEHLRDIFHLLLEPTGLTTGLKVGPEQLVDDCKQVSHKVGSVISFCGDREQDITGSDYIPDEFFNDMESGWKNRVQRKHVEAFYADVEEKAAELISAVEEDFVPILMRTRSLVHSSYGNGRSEICYVREHQSIWFKGKNFKPVFAGESPGDKAIKRLKPALDSKGRKIGDDWHTTARVEAALDSYREAVSKASVAVVCKLRELAAHLRTFMNSIIFLSMFCVIAKALFAHASEGKRRRWCFPDLVDQEEKLIVSGLVPYWLDTTQDFAVRNSVEINSLFLLTGPNGGGKSSLLRSVCAAALLGNCGLMVPATKAEIPEFDSIILRVMSHDSPLEGKSLFQMEMADLRTVLADATRGSLVLVDELCKGTEVQKGTCILGSVIEKLDRLGCYGIISTHLHGILDMNLNIKNVVRKAMGTKRVRGQLQPSWELVDGECRESLAFETARGEGVSDEILRRASQLYKIWFQDKDALGVLGGLVEKKEVLPEENVENGASIASSKSMSSLKDVEQAFLSICRAQPYGSTLPSACFFVGARQQPPPFTSNQSCVYILQRPDGRFYVGQTDNLAGRIASHRSSPGMKQAIFIYLPVANKSVACQLETAAITQLSQMGVDLLNKLDQSHKHFGISPVGGPPF